MGFGVEGGSIEVAKKADFIVIKQDRKLLSLDEEDILVDIRRLNRTISDWAGLTIGPRLPVL